MRSTSYCAIRHYANVFPNRDTLTIRRITAGVSSSTNTTDCIESFLTGRVFDDSRCQSENPNPLLDHHAQSLFRECAAAAHRSGCSGCDSGSDCWGGWPQGHAVATAGRAPGTGKNALAPPVRIDRLRSRLLPGTSTRVTAGL